ncbi:uncharacterized protein [Nicotiana sylvestris]|uniref:Helitron helicase-like domain-containing protein n=1 Tax=Nicotiana tabacum TaxID=4097 RepID=A0A1S3YDG9_TOBAC|nr:PREDICTED: uncharacterized protein LOC107775094 [Nicotiana tabacum]
MCSQLMIPLFLIMGKIYMIALPFLKLGLHQERVVNNIILPCITLQAKLPSVENMCSVNILLDMEAELLEKKKRKRNTVSCREYYCYKLQMRDGEENGVLHAGRVFQQYSVDEFIKLETQRLDFYSFNQDLFRIDALAGILDVLRHEERESHATLVDKVFFLQVL